MDYLQAFYTILGRTGHIALASSLDNAPNVRIISSFYDRDKGVLYIPTFAQSPKTIEFAQNDKVAFTTIPEGDEGAQVVRVSSAFIKKSEIPLLDLVHGFSKNIPDFEASFGPVFPLFAVYEIYFSEAIVTMSHQQTEKIELVVS